MSGVRGTAVRSANLVSNPDLLTALNLKSLIWKIAHSIKEAQMLLRAISLTLLLTSSSALAEDMKAPLNAKDLKWGPAPNVFPKGAQMAIVSGDPFKDGPYVVRLKTPKGYRVSAHNHPTTENLTVLAGNFHIGMGDKFDEKKGMELTTGAYAEAPAKMNHYAWATSNTVVQIHGQGPFAITYFNPADDPSKK
ncbi:MAG TPA: cupin domain-containing protein [Bradyrhizobium sp.]|nr:cupin domain-containing protein [Bradyrhizobium sp.]